MKPNLTLTLTILWVALLAIPVSAKADVIYNHLCKDEISGFQQSSNQDDINISQGKLLSCLLVAKAKADAVDEISKFDTSDEAHSIAFFPSKNDVVVNLNGGTDPSTQFVYINNADTKSCSSYSAVGYSTVRQPSSNKLELCDCEVVGFGPIDPLAPWKSEGYEIDIAAMKTIDAWTSFDVQPPEKFAYWNNTTPYGQDFSAVAKEALSPSTSSSVLAALDAQDGGALLRAMETLSQNQGAYTPKAYLQPWMTVDSSIATHADGQCFCNKSGFGTVTTGTLKMEVTPNEFYFLGLKPDQYAAWERWIKAQ